MLGEEISQAASESGLELNILLGAETKKALVLGKQFKTLKGNVVVSTNDGTYGYHGFFTEMLKDAIDMGEGSVIEFFSGELYAGAGISAGRDEHYENEQI